MTTVCGGDAAHLLIDMAAAVFPVRPGQSHDGAHADEGEKPCFKFTPFGPRPCSPSIETLGWAILRILGMRPCWQCSVLDRFNIFTYQANASIFIDVQDDEWSA